jgi:hypothetical protein
VNKRRHSDTVLRHASAFVSVTGEDARKHKLAGAINANAVPRYIGAVMSESLWLEQPLGSRWRAAYRLVPQPCRRGVRHVIAEVRIFPAEDRAKPGEWSGTLLGTRAAAYVPRGGIPARVMNQVRSSGTYLALQAHVAWLESQWSGATEAFGVGGAGSRSVRGRPPSRTIAQYREFAARYAAVELTKPAQSTRRVLAEHYGVSEATIANCISRARQMELVPKTKPGQRGRSSPQLSEVAAQAALKANRQLTNRADGPARASHLTEGATAKR